MKQFNIPKGLWAGIIIAGLTFFWYQVVGVIGAGLQGDAKAGAAFALALLSYLIFGKKLEKVM